MSSSTRIILAAVTAVTLAGCASSKSGSVYSREDARREQTVRMGVVESVRSVSIEGTKSGIGAVAGGAAGGIGGSAIGHGRGAAVAAVAGAVAGGLIGAAAEEASRARKASKSPSGSITASSARSSRPPTRSSSRASASGSCPSTARRASASSPLRHEGPHPLVLPKVRKAVYNAARIRAALASSASRGGFFTGHTSFMPSPTRRGRTWMWKWNTVCSAAAPFA